jgi:hypothetical protein
MVPTAKALGTGDVPDLTDGTPDHHHCYQATVATARQAAADDFHPRTGQYVRSTCRTVAPQPQPRGTKKLLCASASALEIAGVVCPYQPGWASSAWLHNNVHQC